MNEPCRRQKRLVERKKELRLGEIDGIGGEIGHPRGNAKHPHRQSEPAQNGTVTPRETANPVFAREQETENIDELPCERVKEPAPLDRQGRQVRAEHKSGGIGRERSEQQERRSMTVEKRDGRSDEN